jgi:hypothetical protein
VDSDFPAGTPFNLIFSNPQNELDRQTVTIQENKGTQYSLFDTTGLQSGEYSIDVQFSGTATPAMRSDSVIHQDIHLTGGSAIATKTTIIPTITSILTTELTTIPQTPTTISSAPSTSPPTVSPTKTINDTSTKSVEDLLKEQNAKIDAQNALIAEQNKKLESQNNILNQILAAIKGVFGWK